MDRRSQYEKLHDMANDKSSPNEAREAQRRLALLRMEILGIEPPPNGQFVNPYGDVFFSYIPNLGGWCPLYTSNHFADDETGRVDEPVQQVQDVAGRRDVPQEEAQAEGHEAQVQGST